MTIEIDPAAVGRFLGGLSPSTAVARLRDTFGPHADLDAMLLARQVKAARALVGWTQADLAQRAGVKVLTVKRLERATGKQRESTIASVLAAFQVGGVEFLADKRRGTIGVKWRWDQR